MKKMILLLAIAALGFSTAAQAALINRGADTLGNRLIYDTDLNITWYDYTNPLNNWPNQVSWASGLSVTFGSQTFDDWRLPNTVDGIMDLSYDGSTSYGYNNTSSEIGHLHYTELGNPGMFNTSGIAQTPYGLLNTGEFQHLLTSYYWSGTEYSLGTGNAWVFHTRYGSQGVHGKGEYRNALAVRLGDVVPAPIVQPLTNPVPEPGTWMLLGSGLVGLAAFRRKFARR